MSNWILHSNLLLCALLCTVFSYTVHAQMPSGADHVTFAPVAAVAVAAGKTTVVRLSGSIDKGWNSYGLTPTVTADGIGPQPLVVQVQPENMFAVDTARTAVVKGVHIYEDEVWGTTVEKLTGSIEIDVAITIAKTAPRAKHQASIVVTLQMCDGQICLPPDDVTIPLTIEVR